MSKCAQKGEFPVKNGKIALVRASMVVTILYFSEQGPTGTTVF